MTATKHLLCTSQLYIQTQCESEVSATKCEETNQRVNVSVWAFPPVGARCCELVEFASAPMINVPLLDQSRSDGEPKKPLYFPLIWILRACNPGLHSLLRVLALSVPAAQALMPVPLLHHWRTTGRWGPSRVLDVGWKLGSTGRADGTCSFSALR